MAMRLGRKSPTGDLGLVFFLTKVVGPKRKIRLGRELHHTREKGGGQWRLHTHLTSEQTA